MFKKGYFKTLMTPIEDDKEIKKELANEKPEANYVINEDSHPLFGKLKIIIGWVFTTDKPSNDPNDRSHIN